MKILVGIPLGNNISDAAFLSFWQIAQRGYALIDRGYGRVDVHRNEFAKILLASDFTHLCVLDADHVHPPDVVERLARWGRADEDKFKIVAGLNFRRGEPYDPLAFMVDENNVYHAIAEWPDALFRVDMAAPCAMLIHRSVFEAMAWPYWKYEYRNDNYVTEDLHFCAQARAVGFDIWVDGTLTSPHLIMESIDGSRFRAWIAAHPEKLMPEVE